VLNAQCGGAGSMCDKERGAHAGGSGGAGSVQGGRAD
jgi:hypothetical protein